MMKDAPSLSIEEKHRLEDAYDAIFPEARGRVTEFIRWLYPEQVWAKKLSTVERRCPTCGRPLFSG